MCCYFAYFQSIPGCGKFKKQPLQNEEELAICFQGIVNVGSDHWNPCGNTPTVVVDDVVHLDDEVAALSATQEEDLDGLPLPQLNGMDYGVPESESAGLRPFRPRSSYSYVVS